jgi:hypothetical protein
MAKMLVPTSGRREAVFKIQRLKFKIGAGLTYKIRNSLKIPFPNPEPGILNLELFPDRSQNTVFGIHLAPADVAEFCFEQAFF